MGKSKRRHKVAHSSTAATNGSADASGGYVEIVGELSPPNLMEEKPLCIPTERKPKKDMGTCLVAYRLARDFNTVKPKYHARSQRYIIENFDEAVREPKFYEEVTKDDIIVFLQSEDLIVSCEEVVYHAVIRWVKHKMQERSKYLDELLELVRFPQLELDFLCQHVVQEPLVINSNTGQLLIHEAYEYHNERRRLTKENSNKQK